MNLKELTQSKYCKVVVASIGVLIVAFASFAGGMVVGFHKAKFSYAFGENYERNFAGKGQGRMGTNRGGMMKRFGGDGKFDGRDFRNAHGISGKVISVSGDSIVVSDKNNKENTVAVTDTTIIKLSGMDVKIGDIVKDDKVVVIGSPSESGVVNADFIRVFGQKNTDQ